MKEGKSSDAQFRLLAAMLNETAIDVVTGVAQEEELPKTYALYQNYPNPFNPETTIRFQIPKYAHVKLTIYNVLGQEIKTLIDERLDAGLHTIVWDGSNNAGVKVASGVYIYRMRAGVNGSLNDFIKVRKMVFLK